jgi:glycosyltransferase involved in cell wall biosynthesis
MHILHLIKTSEGALWALEFIKNIKEKYPEVKISVVLPSDGKYYCDYLLVCDNVFPLTYNLNTKIFKSGFELRNLVRTLEPDIIHSWFAQTTLFSRLFLRDLNIPRLFQVVGPLHLECFLFRTMDLFSAQKNDYWVATSRYTYKKYLEHGVHRKRLFFNYIGYNLDLIRQRSDKSEKFDVRREFKLPDHVRIIGTASYMYPPKMFAKAGVKNHEMLLDVFKVLLKRRDDVVLVIGGTEFGSKKKYFERIKKMSRKISSDKILFTDYVSNLGGLISQFDVFVFLSLSENLGGVYESLLFEVPTVSSDRGGIPELIVDGETGFTCDLNSITCVVDRIEKLLDDDQLSKFFKKRGVEKVFEVFNTDYSIEKSFSIYKEIVNNIN